MQILFFPTSVSFHYILVTVQANQVGSVKTQTNYEMNEWTLVNIFLHKIMILSPFL